MVGVRLDRNRVLEAGGVRGKEMLDIGGGPLAIIAARDFGCYVTTIETSREALEEERGDIVREKLEKRVTLVQGDARYLPYRENSFDVVISYGALHHVLDEREYFIDEARRVAREKVIIAELYKSFFSAYHAGNRECKWVDRKWMKKELGKFSKVEKHSGTEMQIYVCFK
ncbi:MAG: class I SAM-dependent methyltransferase [Thermoproteota archaeon]